VNLFFSTCSPISVTGAFSASNTSFVADAAEATTALIAKTATNALPNLFSLPVIHLSFLLVAADGRAGPCDAARKE
jgi:hypothetical protein